jgi:hypothetical protein
MAFELYRIKIEGAHTFQLYLEGNPVVSHPGGTSVHSVMVDEEELGQLRDQISQLGNSVEVLDPVLQDPDQERERLALLGAGRENEVWPSASCPNCSWFDPTLSRVFCGRSAWPTEMVSSFESHDFSTKDLENCPVPHVWSQ